MGADSILKIHQSWKKKRSRDMKNEKDQSEKERNRQEYREE